MNRKHWVCNIGKLLGKLLSITDFFFDHLIWLHDISIVAGETVSVVQDLSPQHKDPPAAVPRLSSRRAWTYLLHGMWELSSPTGDQTHAPGIAEWILNH